LTLLLIVEVEFPGDSEACPSSAENKINAKIQSLSILVCQKVTNKCWSSENQPFYRFATLKGGFGNFFSEKILLFLRNFLGTDKKSFVDKSYIYRNKM